MKIPNVITAMLAGIILTLASLWFGQNHGLMPVAASEEAPLVDDLFNAMMTIAAGLFILVQGALVISIIKFRKRPGDETDAFPVDGNLSLEIVWTAIPVVIVLGLSVYSFEVYNSMGGLDPMASHDHGPHQMAMTSGAAIAAPLPGMEDTMPPATEQKIALGVGASPENQGNPADLEVNVMGLQFAWIFTYPESGVVSGELHIPAGKEVQLNIAAQDVLHAFWVPQFRLKQDAIPARTTELRFKPKVPGDYPVVCAELCGAYHGAMQTRVVVETPEDFEAWLQTQIALQKDAASQTVAMNPGELSDGEFLTPFVRDMGIDSAALEQLHPPAHHEHHNS
uniref:Cytochrome c oxidase subunit 2 n=1 Tax=Planktothricoides sp. SpSt-374 TaxID=2282167 RepID=A0A7C3ZPW2_9CYAN